MMTSKLMGCLLLGWWLAQQVSHGALSVKPDTITRFVGETNVPFMIFVHGGDAISEFVGAVEIVPMSPGTAESNGPLIEAVEFDGSIWSIASGGFVSFLTLPVGFGVLDPNVALKSAHQTVGGEGILCTLRLNLKTAKPGDYQVHLSGTRAGSTILAKGGDPVAAILSEGVIRIRAFDEPELTLRLSILQGRSQFRFDTTDGQRYRLEETTSLGVAPWTKLREIVGDGQEAVISIDFNSASPQTFYRLVRVLFE